MGSSVPKKSKSRRAKRATAPGNSKTRRSRGGRRGKRSAGTRRHLRKHRRARRHTMRRLKKYRQRGGFSLGDVMAELPFGQDAVNVVRSAGAGLSDMRRGYMGVKPTPNPLPYRGQLTSSAPKGGKAGLGTQRKPLDLASLYKKNKSQVAAI